MSVSDEKVEELQQVLDDFDIKIRYKSEGYDVWWHSIVGAMGHVLFFIGFLVTFGKFKKSFNDMSTAIGKHFYLSDSMSEREMSHFKKYMIIRHELIHVLQIQEEGFLKFVLMYFVVPLPFAFTGRGWKYEKEAYVQQIICWIEEAGGLPRFKKNWILDVFSSPSYFFMNPFRDHLKEHFEEIESRVDKGEVTGLWPYRPDLLQDN